MVRQMVYIPLSYKNHQKSLHSVIHAGISTFILSNLFICIIRFL